MGLTQQQLADRVGVSLRTVSGWERGESVPRSKMPVVKDLLAPYLVSEDKRVAVMQRLGTLVRQRREEVGLSRPRMAAETNTSITTIQNIEHGLGIPQGRTMRAIEKALDWQPGIYMQIIDRAGEIDPANIKMEDLDGSTRDTLRYVQTGLEAYSTDDLLAEIGKRARLAEARWKLYAAGVEVPEPSEFRERPDYDLAANDDMTGGDGDPDN